MVEASCAALRASDEVWPGSHLPAAAVESSRLTYLIVKVPTFPPASCSASFSPLTTSSDCGRESPCGGGLEERVSDVGPPPPLSPLSLPPHAANARATTAVAAAPTIHLCMSPLPGHVVQFSSVLRPMGGWQAIQAGLNAPDARLLGRRPRPHALRMLAAVGDRREPARPPGSGGWRRPRP